MEPEMNTAEETPNSIDSNTTFRRPVVLTLIALALGILVDVLFHGHALGISFPLWALFSVAGLLLGMFLETRQAAAQGLLLILPILFLSVMTIVRLEPLTVFLNIVLTLSLLAVWVRVFQTGELWDFGWLDLGLALVFAPLVSWIRPWRILGIVQNNILKERGGRSALAALLRGLVLALPIVAIFVMLLASADLVFGDLVEDIVKWINIDLVLEWAARSFIVIISGVFFLGALVIALEKAAVRKLIGKEKPLVSPFMGFTEAAVILVLVDLLFAVFVVIQFVYLFGGEANITAAGHTYSDYARKGFGELIFLAVLSLGLILGLSTVTRRLKQGEWFNGLSAVLIGFVSVILVSALKRLLLYENAFGFTRLRTYTHIAIIWLAIAFLAFVIALLLDQLRRFSVLAVACVLGFAITLNLVNVDAFIVQQNVSRMQATDEIDNFYLTGLTDDAIPGMMNLLAAADSDLLESILPELECRLEMARARELGWQSFHFSRERAVSNLENIEETLLAPYFAYQTKWGHWEVLVKGESQYCQVQPWPSAF